MRPISDLLGPPFFASEKDDTRIGTEIQSHLSDVIAEYIYGLDPKFARDEKSAMFYVFSDFTLSLCNFLKPRKQNGLACSLSEISLSFGKGDTGSSPVNLELPPNKPRVVDDTASIILIAPGPKAISHAFTINGNTGIYSQIPGDCPQRMLPNTMTQPDLPEKVGATNTMRPGWTIIVIATTAEVSCKSGTL